MADEISLKTLSKTMKWTMLHFIENPEGNNEMEASSVLLHFIENRQENDEMGPSWVRLHFIENPQENNEMEGLTHPNPITAFHHYIYIYEITYMKLHI